MESARAPAADGALPTVTVVVPTYDRRERLRTVQEPLLADPATMQLVVVVDGSRDGSFELLQDMRRTHPALQPVLIENSGPGPARQHGVGLALGDVVLFVDDDVVASEGMVTGHARHHRGRDDLVVLGYMPTRPPESGATDAFTSVLYAREYESACSAYEADPEQVLRRLWGGNLSVRRENLLRVPFHSPGFAASYHEDSDFGLRCLAAGMHGHFDRRLRATHEHHRTLAQFRRDARRQGEGQVQLQRVHAELLRSGGPSGSTGDGSPKAVSLTSVAASLGATRPAVELVSTVTTVLGAVHLVRAQTWTGRLLRRLELRRGARAAGRSARS